MEPLEQLLKTEDRETYGLVCWYLANRGTERYRAGDVINLGVWETARVEREFRLTEESIENIDRCLGMRTRGEASELFGHSSPASSCRSRAMVWVQPSSSRHPEIPVLPHRCSVVADSATARFQKPLSVAVDAAHTLFEPVGIPGDVVVEENVAAFKVDAFASRFGGHQDLDGAFAELARLEKELATAHTILDVQGKVARLLGFSLNDGKNC